LGKKREKTTPIEQSSLFVQVDALCPLCGKSLFYTKDNVLRKNCEIAHIYPLNPTLYESALLENEPRLSQNSNALDNLIPLCRDCHHSFDHPRTVEEYRRLYAIKRNLIEKEKIKKLYYNYTIGDEIISIINILSNQTDISTAKLEYDALRIDKKLRNNFSQILKKHITNDVVDYYQFIKNILAEVDKQTPGKFNLIAANIKSFYLSIKLETTDQEMIFNKMAEWLHGKTEQGSIDSCKAVIAFFIQNCEVFEYVS
jgi:5-methylcytosine-specific restriction endonuclease McrA